MTHAEDAGKLHQIWGALENQDSFSSSSADRLSQSHKSSEQPHKYSGVVFNSESSSTTGTHSQTSSAVKTPIEKVPGSHEPGSSQLQTASDSNGTDGANAPHLISVGSALHESGTCKPCLYLNMKGGCLNGSTCSFCHIPHAKRNRPRPCKSTRIQCKQVAQMLDTIPDPQQQKELAEQLSAKSPYMRTILNGKMRQQENMEGVTTGSSATNSNTPPMSATAKPKSRTGKKSIVSL